MSELQILIAEAAAWRSMGCSQEEIEELIARRIEQIQERDIR